MKNEKILILLRTINLGYNWVFYNTETKEYSSPQMETFSEYKNEKYEKRNIIECLQYELYEEFPLSPSNQFDWDENIKPVIQIKK